MEIVMLSFP